MPRPCHRPFGLPRPAALLTILIGAAATFGCTPDETQTGSGQAEPAVFEAVIRGHDYAFELADEVPAGVARFGFENVGEVPHEVVLVQLNEGVTVEDVGRALQGEADPRELMAGVVGILIADPGQVALGLLEVELESGRSYALLCNFTDTEEAPPHIALGMIRIFQAT